MRHTRQHQWLKWFAWFTAGATLLLIGLGGIVTSKGAGMAVPDWPTSYGYNMFALPFSYWVGGILWEHSHRLLASFVGFLTILLMVWLWLGDSRRWLKWSGVAALIMVILQGVLGGLRVVQFKDELGIVHATLAQLFLVFLCFIALACGRWWKQEAVLPMQARIPGKLGYVLLALCLMVVMQLVLGATMRHQHAGLAVPDFPLAYGEVWPETSPEAVAEMNRSRHDTREFNPITAGHVQLHMAHRTGALLVVAAACVFFVWMRGVESRLMRRLSALWLGVIFLQAALGAWTVWSNKAADVATLHVWVGAISLVVPSMMAAIAFRWQRETVSREDQRERVDSAAFHPLETTKSMPAMGQVHGS